MLFIRIYILNEYYVTIIIFSRQSRVTMFHTRSNDFSLWRGRERKLKVRESIGNSERMDDLIETRNVITRYLCIENKIVFASRENGECPSNNINMYIYISLGFSFSVNNEFRIE